MTWKGFFEGIQAFAEDVLFLPFEFLRSIELDNWWVANIMSWLLFAIGMVAFVYWMGQLKKANDNGEEDKSFNAHSYLD